MVSDQGCEPLQSSLQGLKSTLVAAMSGYCLHLHGRWEHQGPKLLRKSAGVALTLLNEDRPSNVGGSVAHTVSVAPARILCMQDPDRLCAIPESTWLRGVRFGFIFIYFSPLLFSIPFSCTILSWWAPFSL